MKIADAIQQEAFAQAPTVPLGIVLYPQRHYQASLKDLLVSQAPFFWSVRRA